MIMKEINVATTGVPFRLALGICNSDDPAVDNVAKTPDVINHAMTLGGRGALLVLMFAWYSSDALIMKEHKTSHC
jgi:hypothetical protein